MAEDESTLRPEAGRKLNEHSDLSESESTLLAQGSPLKEKVKNLTFMNKVTHLGKQFSEPEKQQWWEAKSKKFKVGLIRNKELDVAIKIFTESFDFSKKLKNKNSGVESYVDAECREPVQLEDELNTKHEPSNASSETSNASSENSNAVSETSNASSETSNAVSENSNAVSETSNASSETSNAVSENSNASSENSNESVDPNRLAVNNLEMGEHVSGLFNNAPNAPEGDVEIARPAVGGDGSKVDENDATVEPNTLDDDDQLVNDLYQSGFNTEGNIKPEELEGTPETIGTASDFERLYLGWMNNPELSIEDSEKKVRKNTIKSLFRFVFGTKQISDVTATKIQKKFRIAYTPLTVNEKIPCKDEMGALWEDFRESLVYRRRLAVCELYATKDLIGEQTLYTDEKKRLILGLRDLINLLDQTVYPCMEYGYNASMMVDDEEDADLMADVDYVRLLKVFRTFVKDKKEGRKFYSLQNLKREFSKKEPVSEEAQVLYNELLALLTWTAGEAEATAKIADLEAELEEIRKIAKEQQIDIQELEDLVLLLSVVLALSEKMHKIQLELEKLKCSLEKCCHEKKDGDRAALQAQLRKLQEDYVILEKKLKKQSCDDCDEVQELEDIILVLVAIITSMNQLHKIDRSLLELKNVLDICCERKKAAKRCEERLAALEKKLFKENKQTAQAKAALLVAQQGRNSANKMVEELKKQIRDLRDQLEGVVKEGEAKRAELQGLLNAEKSKGGDKTREYRDEVDRLTRELREGRDALRRATERAEDAERDAGESRKEAEAARGEAAGARGNRNAAQRDAEEARREADERIRRVEEEAREARRAADAAIGEARRLQREAEEARREAEEAAEVARGGEAEAAAAQRDAEAHATAAEAAAAEQQAAAEEARRRQAECDEALAAAQLERNAAVRRAEGAETAAVESAAAARESERLRAEAVAARTEAEAAAAGSAATAAEANGRAAVAAAASEEAARGREAAEEARAEAERAAAEAERAAAAAREQARRNQNAATAARDQAAAAAAEAEASRARLVAQEATAAAASQAAAARLAQLQADAEEAAAAAAEQIAAIEGQAALNRETSAEDARRAAEEIARIREEAEAARERAEGAMKGIREHYETQLEGLTTELLQTRRNRNAAQNALGELHAAMREQETAATEAIEAARAETAAAEEALTALREASEGERAAAAAALATKQAALDAMEAEKTRLLAQNTELEEINAGLTQTLAFVNGQLAAERAANEEREEEYLRQLREQQRIAGMAGDEMRRREAEMRAQRDRDLADYEARRLALVEKMHAAEDAHLARVRQIQDENREFLNTRQEASKEAIRKALADQRSLLNWAKNEAVKTERVKGNARLAEAEAAAAEQERLALERLRRQGEAAAAALAASEALGQQLREGLEAQLAAEVQMGTTKSAAISNLSGRIRAMEQAADANRREAAAAEEEAERRKAAANAAEAEAETERRRKAAANAAEAEAEAERRRKAAANAAEAEAEAERRRKAAANAEEAERRRAAAAPSPAVLEHHEEQLRSTKDEFLHTLLQAVQGDRIQAKQVLKMIIEQLQIFGRGKRNSEGKPLDNYMAEFLKETPFRLIDARGVVREVNTPKDFWAFSKAAVGHIFTEEANDEIVIPYLVDRIIDLISRFAETEGNEGIDVFTLPGMEAAIFGSLAGLAFPITKSEAVENEAIPSLKLLSAAEIRVFQTQRALGLATRIAPPEDPPSLARLHARMRANPVFMETIGNRLRVLLRLPPREPVATYLESYRGLSAEAKERLEPSLAELAGRDTGRQKFWRDTRADLEFLAAKGQKVTSPPKGLKGGGKAKETDSFCQTMITLLLLEARQSHEFDIQEFLDKAGTTLDDLGQCPLVLHMLNKLIDEGMNQNVKEDGYVFSPLDSDAEEFNVNLEDAYYNRFTPEQQEILKSMGPPITFHSETPEAFREILGTNSYFLNGSVPEEVEETPLFGLGEDEDPVSLTKEEREAVERKGAGIPLGALLFLYLMCLRDLKDSGENPSLDSKCPLPTPLKPKRAARASSPKRRA
jgi:hypothetical protein